ncbi:SGNH/GDSL hydrolase family protein [Siphonobacter sp. BAB-5385]|uniref:SGNH/GDSL hydrolase family protein n=2 Tax=unclassified Siphonobacter TaxID=2635712 RepID=UPI0020CFB1A4|nr:SGNH/GDSL hydrolase family protein [Siphonobacter sp. BAB-5385]
MRLIYAVLTSKRFAVLMLVSLLYQINLKAQPFSRQVHRIVFLGNSITYDGRYVTDVAAYLRVKYPRQNYEIINVGLPSETVSGLSEPNHADGKFPRPDLHERLSRVLQQTKPDLVIACYGMNDGIYLPWDESRFAAFRTGVQWLHDQVVKAGTPIIHVTPPVYDESRGQAQGYAAVLDRYAEWLLAQREAQQWRVLDLHFPMKTYLETQRQQNATFYLAEDGIHPQEQGHWLMAQQLLVGLGEDQVATATDARASVAFHPKGAQLLELEAEKQSLMKDAWLTATGHQRPGMKKGLPLAEAQQKAAALTKQQKALLR